MDLRVRNIKKSQKESLYLREFSNLFIELIKDHPDLAGLSLTRAELNDKKSFCTYYFYDNDGEAAFGKKLNILKLYKPSIRSSLAQKINSRYVPEIRFEFDSKFEKEIRMDAILEKIKNDSGS